MIERAVTVCDAGPIIHLDELDCLDLLRGFQTLIVPEAVWAEVQRHRVKLMLNSLPPVELATPAPDDILSATDLPFRLQAADLAALALARQRAALLLLTDDLDLRVAAELLNIRAQGTLGLLLRAVRCGFRTKQEMRAILETMPERTTLHITTRLRQEALAALEQLPT